MIISYGKKINRKVRVFISSTFSDMIQERNIIVYSVFPRLRQEFSTQMINVTEVDLRWGIPEEDSENSKILEICIGEVLHCAPFFVGIVGQQYGTIVPMDIISNLPPAYKKALGENLPNDVSITELEMRAGVFVPNNIDFSCFFIRKNVDKKEIYPQVKRLIENISTSYSSYTYDNLGTFEEQMFQSLKKCILKVIPEKLDVPYGDKYYYSHLSVLKNNASHYEPNVLFITAIERQIYEKRRLYLKGGKGIGKSACISWLAKQEGIDRNGNVFFHFAATGNESLNIDNAFFRLRLYLQSLTDYKSNEIDNRAIVTELLAKLPNNFKAILYFDAIDQFNDVTSIYQFFALADINQNISVVCSGTEDYVRIPKDQIIEMENLTEDQILSIIKGSLKQFGKKLDGKMQVQVIKNASCSNPLFLQVLITQLRMYGTYNTFEVFFKQLIKVNTFSEVFSIVVERLKLYFLEYDMQSPLVDKALALIVYSKNGVSENELQEILNCMPVTRSVFFSAIEMFTIEEKGLIRFNHDLIIQAVKEILSKADVDYEKIVAENYVEYFYRRHLDWRRYSEETFQLYKLNRVDFLVKCLSNKDCFMYLCRNEYHSIIGYLSGLINKQYSLIDILCPQLDGQEKIMVAEVFCQAGCHQAAILIVDSQLYKENDSDKKIKLMGIKARSQYKLGLNNFQTSIDTYRELLSYYEIVYPENKIGYAARAYLLGISYKTAGKLDLADEILKNCAEIYKRQNVLTSTAVWIMDVYGGLCYASGRLKKALKIFEKAVDTCIGLFGKSSTELAWAYCYGWNILYVMGEKSAALKKIWDAYEIYNQIYFEHGDKVAWASLNAGIAAMIEGNIETAKKFYCFSIDENDSVLSIQERPHVYSLTGYANLANLFEYEGYHKEAINNIVFALEESRKKNGSQHIYTANFLLNAGVLEHNPNQIKDAIILYDLQAFKTPDIYFARVCYARILSLIGNVEEAKSEISACAREYFSIARETGLISYLIYETLDKVCGNLSDDMLDIYNELYRFDDYKFYLTHNNHSNIIIIPLI